ncbi:MAG: YwaF family protein [Clostridia bacterium]|nr:YwaF family protein [Clostridia bacterium]
MLQLLFRNFFTHKDFLPPASELPGTLFTWLHVVFATVVLAAVIFLGLLLSRRSEKTIRTVFALIWGATVVLELAKIFWETYAGNTVSLELTGVLPLYPCSIFLYAMPFAIFGRGWVRYMGCGYVCSLGLLGGAINFLYPANVLSNYSCISFAGFHTFFYHGAIVFCALVMLRSGYHSYKRVTRAGQLLIPAIPALAVSVVANAINFSKVDSDYMFFKLESFFFAPIGAATPDWFSVILVYFLYLFIHAMPYLPGYVLNKKRATQSRSSDEMTA